MSAGAKSSFGFGGDEKVWWAHTELYRGLGVGDSGNVTFYGLVFNIEFMKFIKKFPFT